MKIWLRFVVLTLLLAGAVTIVIVGLRSYGYSSCRMGYVEVIKDTLGSEGVFAVTAKRILSFLLPKQAKGLPNSICEKLCEVRLLGMQITAIMAAFILFIACAVGCVFRFLNPQPKLDRGERIVIALMVGGALSVVLLIISFFQPTWAVLPYGWSSPDRPMYCYGIPFPWKIESGGGPKLHPELLGLNLLFWAAVFFLGELSWPRKRK